MTSYAVRTALVVFALYGLVVLPSAGAPQDGASDTKQPTFTSGVELATLNVTVTDEQRRFVAGLGPADFAVYEDGIRQELAYCGAATVPVDVAILLDMSSSMTGAAALLERAALEFVRTLRPDDRGMVVGFAARPRLLQPLTRSRLHLESAVHQLHMTGETALYDAVSMALQELARERDRYSAPRRQALVVLSDGDDTSSTVRGAEVLAAARGSGVTVYVIRLATLTSPTQPAFASSRFTSQAASVLTQLTQDSGGRLFTPKARHLSDVYAEIAAELSAQYLLAYEVAPRRAGGASGPITVRVPSRPDVDVRTRRGYQAAQPRP